MMAASKEYSDLTRMMIVFEAVPYFDMNYCVDWAIEMLQLNYETPSLLILAGFTKPVDTYEAKPYLLSSLKELHLKQKTGDEGAITYSSYFIKEIAQSISIKKNLYRLCKYYLGMDYPKFLNDFYLLYYAWDDLDRGYHQWYWKGANRDNIEDTVLAIANQWLIDYKEQYEFVW